jgi:hypothetical protein
VVTLFASEGVAIELRDGAFVIGQMTRVLNATSMSEHGVITAVSDVENGKRFAYTANSTPPTKEVLRVLLQGHFPGLQATSIIGTTAPDQVLLGDRSDDRRIPFVDSSSGEKGRRPEGVFRAPQRYLAPAF